MGCFHSIPVHLPEIERASKDISPESDEIEQSSMTPAPVCPLHEIPQNHGDVGLGYLSTEVFEGFLEAPSDGILSVSVTSPDLGLRSDIAEDTASRSGDSVDDLAESETPGPIVSPNPLSPIQTAPAAYLPEIQVPPVPLHTAPQSSMYTTPAGSIRFSSQPPTQLPETRAASPSPVKRSHLLELTMLRNTKLCMQVLGVWRSDVLKSKIDSLKLNLDLAGKASEVILAENDHLKNLVLQMEEKLKEKSVAPKLAPVELRESVSIQTDSVSQVPSTPPKALQDMSNWVTPPSAKQPMEEVRRSWESITNFSNTMISPIRDPVPSSQSVRISPFSTSSPQSEKFRQISNDIARLTESIGKFELKKTKTPVTSAVTTPSTIFTP